MKSSHTSGFTLVEVLVVVAIIGVLSLIGMASIRSVREKARAAVEVNAARNLIAAYVAHATENGGRVLAGYQQDDSVTNLEGNPLHFPINARYPWRLTPSLPQIEGVMLYNGNEKALASGNSDYLVSVQPNMGLNSTMVGGHFGTGSPLPATQRMVDALGKFYLSHLAESDNPQRLIVFASARSGQDADGYFEVRPPNLTRRIWSSKKFSSSSAPADYGFVDMRWGGKAAVACLAGNVELLNEKELRDMRRWSIQADAAGDRNFMVRPQ